MAVVFSIPDAFDKDTIVVTANERLARALALDHARRMREAGRKVWERPPIFSWRRWLDRLFNNWQAESSGQGGSVRLLGAAQAEVLWESVIRESPAGSDLLQLAATAAAASEAWRLLHTWRVPLEELRRDEHEDVRAFASWAAAYAKRCAAEGWLDEARLADFLREQFQAGRLPVPAAISLAGFDELTPQQEALLAGLEQADGKVRRLAPPAAGKAPRQHPCADAQAEIVAAAYWARGLLERNPTARIGIVVHDLEARRAALQRALDEALQPSARLPGGIGAAPFNVSLGRPLAETPLVRDGLLALGLLVGPLPCEQAGALLRSPFFTGAAEEGHVRAALDVRMRAMGRERLRVGDLRQLAAGMPGAHQLADALSACAALSASLPARQSPGGWAETFSAWLRGFGWPRGRLLDSAEYQALQAWQDLLGILAGLDSLVPAITVDDAVARLRHAARDTLFQPQTPDAPLQVLGMLEAAGMAFEHLWIMGLHDSAWPPSPRPNPFLPARLQRQLGLPHASAARELAFAERVTQRLLDSAPDVIVSWPQREGDADLRPSPLIAELPPSLLTPPPSGERRTAAASLVGHIHANAPGPESFADATPVPVSAAEEIRGGTRLLKNQAACPFRAFAEHRLHAVPLEQPASGLNAADRGALVHGAMEILWRELRDQQRLLELDAAARETLVRHCVAQAVTQWTRRNPGVLTGRFRAVETGRLVALALAWLEQDALRAPFRVEPPETVQAISVGKLRLRGRPDRIDCLPDGSRVVVDYKTGKANPAAWLGTRPDEPQLPLYALANRKQLAGVLFAQLRAGDTKYAGVSRAPELAPGVPDIAHWKKARDEGCDNFDGLLDYWQRQLEALAADFHAGHAVVDPKDVNTSCRYCHLSALCRIDELSAGARDLVTEDGADD